LLLGLKTSLNKNYKKIIGKLEKVCKKLKKRRLIIVSGNRR
jgi:hypothetical protein